MLGVVASRLQGAHSLTRAENSSLHHSALPITEISLARFILSFRRFTSAAMSRSKVFFDMAIGGAPAGRIVFEVSTTSVSCMPIDSCTPQGNLPEHFGEISVR